MATVNSDLHRADGRAAGEMRKVTITRGFTDNPAGPVLVTFGNTRVMCTASAEQSVLRFKRDPGEGWLTAEYSMLSASTHERMPHESIRGKVKGCTHKALRLIDRSLRAAIDLKEPGENTINIDCGVLQVDGGIRTTSIIGAYVALVDALTYLHTVGVVPGTPLKVPVAVVSVGTIDGRVCLDLPYEEDSRAEVDLNVVMTAEGKFVEIQGAGKEDTSDRDQLNDMLDSAEKGLREFITLQQEMLCAPYPGELP